jgi:hypothetical protein
MDKKETEDLLNSHFFLALSGKINLFGILIAITVGLIGNFLTIFVFSHKRFRNNSSNIYLLCLAVIDSCFLIFHFFEDTIRTIEETYLENEEEDDEDIYNLDTILKNNFNSNNNNNNSTQYLKQIIIFLNIADKSDLACGLINFFRYFLRFQSAYIIVAFTLQRVIIVFSPLANRFKSKQSAWKTFHFITFISVIINLWVPFYFKVHI